MRRLPFVVLLAVAAACGPAKKKEPTPADKGVSTGARTTKTIGASGGSIASSDGNLTLEFPMGALMADTEIGVEPITNTAPLGRGTAYRLTPDGSKFMKPVKLTFKYADADLKGASKEALRVAFQGSDGFWHTWTQNTRDDGAKTVTQETTHFTDVTKVMGWQLTPFEARVETLGTVELKLNYCLPEMTDDELSGLTPRCDLEDPELPAVVNVKEWAVNGKPGGSFGEGLINGNGRVGTFTAPSEEPPVNPAAVSVSFGVGSGTNLAVANVMVAPAGWAGTVTWTLAGEKTTNEAGSMKTWKVNGSGSMTVKSDASQTPMVTQVSSTFTNQYDETTMQMYQQGSCMHSVNAVIHETTSGMVTTGASVFIFSDGTSTTAAVGIPGGETTGMRMLISSDTVTGQGCTQPMPVNQTTPATGTTPSDTLSFMFPGNANELTGTKTLRVDGSPPRDYTVTFSLRK